MPHISDTGFWAVFQYLRFIHECGCDGEDWMLLFKKARLTMFSFQGFLQFLVSMMLSSEINHKINHKASKVSSELYSDRLKVLSINQKCRIPTLTLHAPHLCITFCLMATATNFCGNKISAHFWGKRQQRVRMVLSAAERCMMLAWCVSGSWTVISKESQRTEFVPMTSFSFWVGSRRTDNHTSFYKHRLRTSLPFVLCTQWRNHYYSLVKPAKKNVEPIPVHVWLVARVFEVFVKKSVEYNGAIVKAILVTAALMISHVSFSTWSY